MTFPVNSTISMAQADKMLAFIRKHGAATAIVQAHTIGVPSPEMRGFVYRNRAAWDTPKEAA